MNADEGQEWFLGEIDQLGLDAAGENRAWVAAARVFKPGTTDPKRWKGWIRKSVKDAYSKSSGRPGGLFIRILEDGPQCDLGSPEDSVARRYPDRTAELAAQRAERDRLPDERPSLVEAVRALKYGGERGLREYLDPFYARERTTVTTI